MKNILLLLSLVFSAQIFALEVEGTIVDADQFEQNMSVEKSLHNFWQTSATTCYAVTRCPYGGVASCRVFGFNYAGVPAHLSNFCSWAVWPGRGVRCQGYTQVRDYYGRFIWTWVDVPVSCF